MTLLVRTLDPTNLSHVASLAGLLTACVQDGASVGFMNEVTAREASDFWMKAIESAARGERGIFIAEDGGTILGTAQIIPAPMPNQPHRADIAKVLVRPDARRRGIGACLMQACEAEALRQRRWLLTLDTVTGSAGEALYLAMGWQRTGAIPDYALMPDGTLCATMIMWKRLQRDDITS